MPVAAIAAAAIFFSRDVAISDWVYRDRSELVRDFARRFSAYADFRLPVELFVVFSLAGAWKKRRDWRRLGLAILLAASVAGTVDNTIRMLTGRPRPSANLPDHFTGPHLMNHYLQSFPSGHSASAMATAAVVAVTMPEVGIPFFIFSLGVPWSRVYMHDHYVSDVIVGGLIGLWFGAAFGIAQRKLRAGENFQALEK